MKVKDLIEQLQKLNPEIDVRVGQYYSNITQDIKRVDTSTIWGGINGDYYRIDLENIE